MKVLLGMLTGVALAYVYCVMAWSIFTPTWMLTAQLNGVEYGSRVFNCVVMGHCP